MIDLSDILANFHLALRAIYVLIFIFAVPVQIRRICRLVWPRDEVLTSGSFSEPDVGDVIVGSVSGESGVVTNSRMKDGSLVVETKESK